MGIWRALLAPLIAVPLLTGTAAAAEAPTGAFAESYGLRVGATLVQDDRTVVTGPSAVVASSCPSNTPASSRKVVGKMGDPAAARADRLSTGTATDCVSATARATAQATKAELLGTAGPLAIRADSVTTQSTTSCGAPPSGSTEFVNLTVGGIRVPLPTDVKPNTALLPEVFGPLGLRVILNEQHPASGGRGLVVNGIHVIAANSGFVPAGGMLARGDVVVSHAVSGVSCKGAPGSTNSDLPQPDITFAASAMPVAVKAGDTITFTATTSNNSAAPCEVLRFTDHLAPAFALVSTVGPLGSSADAVLRPTGFTLTPGDRLVQTLTVKVRPGTAPGTYFNNLELTCVMGGDFVSGPLAPFTVLDDAAGGKGSGGIRLDGVAGGEQLAETGATPALVVAALLLLIVAFGMRRTVLR